MTRAKGADALPPESARRVVIEGVSPEIDCGRFAVKRTVGEEVVVEADAFTDGHAALACVLLYRREDETAWNEVPMNPLGNDRWRAAFTVDALGPWRYTVEARVDPFDSWRRDLKKRLDAGQDVEVDLAIGAELLRDAAARAPAGDREILETLAERIETTDDAAADAGAPRAADPARPRRKTSPRDRLELALDDEMAALVHKHADHGRGTRYRKELEVWVDRERARFSAWYEMFPRSAAPEAGRHGTFRDVEERLGYVAGMGFDVLYLPPIHPIGTTHRKGKNNARTAAPRDVGSPWAIGASGPRGGGHKSVHPELGTLADFRRLVERARDHGLEIALDVAFQCSPDHPYLAEHPEWFRWRPDGTIQYAENPPKKYEDIVPFDFDTDDWRALWEELASVFEFWIGQGVKIFRVDNPHTKPFRFWEWLIADIRAAHPEVIFLSEAFTRPKVLYRLAKLGFTQSYNYFPWRNGKWELTEYLTELTRTEVADFCRPNLWTNTPDILTERLQIGGRPAFAQRLILAATLGASYGIYGPPFELLEATPRGPGSEEYLDSEKYALRKWDLDRPDGLRDLIARVNRIRRENPALQQDRTLAFHGVDNDHLLCYSKSAPAAPPEAWSAQEAADVVLVVVNLDPHHRQAGWTSLDLGALGVDGDRPYQVHDLLTDARYLWQGGRNYVELDPHAVPAHVFRIRRHVHREEDFDYFV